MTTIGGLGHTLPYLIPDFWTATVVADHRGGGRTRRDLLDPLPLHGHAVPVGGVPGHGRRRAGLPRRHPDRQSALIRRRLSSLASARCSSSRICPTRISGRCRTPRLPSSLGKRGLGFSTGGASGARSTAPTCSTRIVADLKAQAPDHIAVTGDLVNIVADRRIRAGARLARTRSARRTTSRSCPAITTPMCAAAAAARARTGATTCAATTAAA